MAKFNFKSSGVQVDKIQQIKEDKNSQILPAISNIGIKTPLEIGTSDLFRMHNNIVEQVKDNFKNLILTNHGERLGLYDYGANLRPLLTEYSADTNDDFINNVTDRIIQATNKWMPYIELEDLKSEVEENTINGIAVIAIMLKYSVSGAGVGGNRNELKVRLFVI